MSRSDPDRAMDRALLAQKCMYSLGGTVNSASVLVERKE
jgi:hypothetical protein